jgi:hypothetical protein
MAAAGKNSKAYKDQDDLWPTNCPPTDAKSIPHGVYLRLTSANPATKDDFRSGHAEGKKRPKKRCDECTWRACSVWVESTSQDKLAGLAKLPTLSNKKFIVHFRVSSAAGMVKPHHKDKEHLSFWMHQSFEPEKLIIKYVAL